MNPKNIINLGEFKNAAQESAREIKQESPDLVLDYAGLIPNADPAFRYDCTPINTTVFAVTGGDGVHFSILELSETVQPIVMTVPMNFGNAINSYNWILGEHLNEFLSLGYYHGWFALEQLCYDQDWVVKCYSKENEAYKSDEIAPFLSKLSKKLNVEPRPLHLDRLKNLEAMYFEQLRFKAEFMEQLGQRGNKN